MLRNQIEASRRFIEDESLRWWTSARAISTRRASPVDIVSSVAPARCAASTRSSASIACARITPVTR